MKPPSPLLLSLSQTPGSSLTDYLSFLVSGEHCFAILGPLCLHL